MNRSRLLDGELVSAIVHAQFEHRLFVGDMAERLVRQIDLDDVRDVEVDVVQRLSGHLDDEGRFVEGICHGADGGRFDP